jgi:hypothetical protein
VLGTFQYPVMSKHQLLIVDTVELFSSPDGTLNRLSHKEILQKVEDRGSSLPRRLFALPYIVSEYRDRYIVISVAGDVAWTKIINKYIYTPNLLVLSCLTCGIARIGNKTILVFLKTKYIHQRLA